MVQESIMFQEFLQIDKREASSFLINRLLEDEFFWKYEYMFSAFLKSSKDINPIILNYLYRLLPAFIRDDAVASYYISSFSDNIYQVIKKDKKLAKESLVGILARDLNSHSEQLSDKSIKKLQVLKNHLNVSIAIQKSEKENATPSTFGEKNLQEKLIIQFQMEESLKEKSIEELNKYFDKKAWSLNDKDIIFLVNYINKKNDFKVTGKLLTAMIQKEIIFDETYYRRLNFLVNLISCTQKQRVLFLVNIFIHSQNGWLSNFINQDSLKQAIVINKELALEYLSKGLEKKFNKIYYYTQSTANLIIAFEYAGLKKKDILSMYKRGFEFIEYRLPDQNNFKWEDLKDTHIDDMSNDEIAIVMILVKIKNLDSTVQKEIIMAIDYLLNYDESLLVKPFKWFFENIDYFPHMSIASIFELFLLYVDNKQDFFQTIKNDLTKATSLQNLSIQKNLNILLERINDV